MALLFEEIVVDLMVVLATLAGIACLVYLLVLCGLERREMRRQAQTRGRESYDRHGSAQLRPHHEAPRRPHNSTVQAQS